MWLQIKADILGCEIIPVKAEETGAMGSAILGLAAVTDKDVFEVASRFWQYGEPIHPDTVRQTFYNERYETYKTLRNQFYVSVWRYTMPVTIKEENAKRK